MDIGGKSNWDFDTSAGGAIGGGAVLVVQAGGGLLRIQNKTDGKKFEIDYGFLGGGIGAGGKVKGSGGLSKAVNFFLKNVLHGLSGGGSLPAFPSTGIIFRTGFAPAGDLPLKVFQGFFQFVSVDAIAAAGVGLGGGAMAAAFFKPGVMPALDIIAAAALTSVVGPASQLLVIKDVWAVGLFAGAAFLGAGLGASLTGNTAIVFRTKSL